MEELKIKSDATLGGPIPIPIAIPIRMTPGIEGTVRAVATRGIAKQSKAKQSKAKAPGRYQRGK